MALLKQSTAYTRMFLLVQSSDHISGLTGATPSVSLSKAGGAFASAGGTVTEVANGWYKIALTTTDTNTLGDLAYHITATSGDPTDFADQVVAFDTQDSAALGLSRIDAAISSRMATFTLPTNFSALGISAGGHISSVDTLTTYTGNTPQTGDAFARLGAPAGASVSADIAAVKSDIDAGVTVGTVASAATNVKKAAALANFMFVMTDSTTHAPKTGLTVTATRSLDGAAFASCANAVSEISNGWYQISLATTDTNANRLALRFAATGADDLDILIITQP